MKKKLLAVFAALVGLSVVAWLMAAPDPKVKPGDMLPRLDLASIHGASVEVPSAGSKWVHLQFRRFAGCPICNLHLKSFVERSAEIASAGIREVVVFHSSKEALLPFQGKFPFDVIADPGRRLYDQFGVGSSIFSILDVRSWPAMIEGNGVQDRPKGDPEGGPLGRPADFLIAPDGKVVASHYGRHAYDQWSVDMLLSLAK